jgi:hypothetical protein
MIQIKALYREEFQLAFSSSIGRRPPMYENAAMLAAFLLIYSAVAGRIERSWTSGPIVFTELALSSAWTAWACCAST